MMGHGELGVIRHALGRHGRCRYDGNWWYRRPCAVRRLAYTAKAVICVLLRRANVPYGETCPCVATWGHRQWWSLDVWSATDWTELVVLPGVLRGWQAAVQENGDA